MGRQQRHRELVEALTPPGTATSTITRANHQPGSRITTIMPSMVGKWVQALPGNANAHNVRSQLDWFISTQTPMAIPLYDAVAGQGTNGYYRVGQLCAFVLQDYDLTGQDKSITASSSSG